MNVFDVPNQEAVDQTIHQHHQSDQEKVELIVLCRGNRQIGPLHTHAHFLVESKVLGAQTKRSGGEERLKDRDLGELSAWERFDFNLV